MEEERDILVFVDEDGVEIEMEVLTIFIMRTRVCPADILR